MNYYHCSDCGQEVPEIGGYDNCERCNEVICQSCLDDHICSILNSLEQALKEVKLMQEGKLPKRNAREVLNRIRRELIEEESDKIDTHYKTAFENLGKE